MQMTMVMFQGVAVGIRLGADSEEEQRLLWALRGLPAKVNEEVGLLPFRLTICPELPWGNKPQ